MGIGNLLIGGDALKITYKMIVKAVVVIIVILAVLVFCALEVQ